MRGSCEVQMAVGDNRSSLWEPRFRVGARYRARMGTHGHAASAYLDLGDRAPARPRLERPRLDSPYMASERQITVGGVKIGGGAPVVVQSMTLTKTHDVEATTAQIAALA